MAEPPTPLLQARGLAAGYGGKIVLRDADVTVRAGDWLGLLGANGSGKSTLLRALTGQIPLKAGSVCIGGIDLRAHPERAKMGFGYRRRSDRIARRPDRAPISADGRVPFAACAPSAWPHEDLPGLLALSPWLDHQIAACSLGTRAKLSIAAALLGAPPLLILDEALNGLDPLVSIPPAPPCSQAWCKAAAMRSFCPRICSSRSPPLRPAWFCWRMAPLPIPGPVRALTLARAAPGGDRGGVHGRSRPRSIGWRACSTQDGPPSQSL